MVEGRTTCWLRACMHGGCADSRALAGSRPPAKYPAPVVARHVRLVRGRDGSPPPALLCNRARLLSTLPLQLRRCSASYVPVPPCNPRVPPRTRASSRSADPHAPAGRFARRARCSSGTPSATITATIARFCSTSSTLTPLGPRPPSSPCHRRPHASHRT